MQRQWLHSKWMILIGLLILVLATAVFWQSGARAQGQEGAAIVPDGPTADCANDDSYENNDFLAAAPLLTPGSYNSLVVCAADDWDAYKVAVPAGHTLHAELLFTHSNGDINLELWESNSGVPVVNTHSNTDNESAEMTVATSDYYYIVATFLETSGNNLYTLNLNLSCQNCFTYQGQLQTNGSPANGEYQFQFRLYETTVNGPQLIAGPITRTESVTTGLFTTDLYFGETTELADSAVLGSADTIDIRVRPANSSNAFTPLTPRQPMLPAPVAHTLQPGALISGTIGETEGVLRLSNQGGSGLHVLSARVDGVFVESAGYDGVFVESAGWNGLYVESANDDGVHICATGDEFCSWTDGNGDSDGIEIIRAEDNGLFVNDSGDHGVHIESAGAAGVNINSAGADGVHIDHAGSSGVQVSNAQGNGLSVISATNGLAIGTAQWDGVSIGSTGSEGISIDAAGTDGIHICSTGSESSCTYNQYNHGVEIGNADNDGLHVTEAGGDGLEVCATGTQSSCTINNNDHGVEVGNAEHDGLHITNAGRDGLDVENAGADGVLVRSATDWAADFNGSINVSGSCTGCSTALMGVNKSERPLQPGDLVASQQTAVGDHLGQQILVDVEPAVAGQGVIGVVAGRAELVETDRDDGTTGTKLVPRDGAAQPGDYVTIIIYGPAQVQVDPASEITPNERLTVDENGLARPLQTTTVNDIQVAEDAPTIGIALASKPNDDGMIWILVNPQ